MLFWLQGCAAANRSATVDATTRMGRELDPALDWYGDNAARLQVLIDTHGRQDPSFDPRRPPVAVFDFDNTLIKNDIGRATFLHTVAYGLVRQPPDGDWARTSPHLTESARVALRDACGATVVPGGRLDSQPGSRCGDEILAIAYAQQTVAGAPAFVSDGFDHRAFEPALAWRTQILLGGRTEAEVAESVRDVIAAQIAAAVGATMNAGEERTVPGYIRFYPQSRDLVQTMHANGFAVWVVSASAEPVVEMLAARIGLPSERVIGVRVLRDGNGRYGYGFEGCGELPDGRFALLTYKLGKRCFVNKVIFGLRGATAMDRQEDSCRRPVFAAGDADTDIDFMRDARVLRLVLNRNQSEIMCHAYANRDGRWMVNPMFIEPLPRRAETYACSKDGCKRSDGSRGPCLDDLGAPLPDQQDRVY